MTMFVLLFLTLPSCELCKGIKVKRQDILHEALCLCISIVCIHAWRKKKLNQVPDKACSEPVQGH